MSTAYELFWSAALGNNSKLVNLAKAATEELRAENADAQEWRLGVVCYRTTPLLKGPNAK